MNFPEIITKAERLIAESSRSFGTVEDHEWAEFCRAHLPEIIDGLREDGGLVDQFIQYLNAELNRLGIDTSSCDGEEAPHIIIAGWIAGRIKNTEEERDTALAAKDAAEKRLSEVAKAWENGGGFALAEACRALTPAPTQEPPAGGVTITQPLSACDGTHGGARCGAIECWHDTAPQAADVPSVGRGELLPFNLSDALAGKPVVTRNGKSVTGFKEIDHIIYPVFGLIDESYAYWTKKGEHYHGIETDWDLFMLPPEGSGA